MSARSLLDTLPRPAPVGLYGAVAGLLVALTAGELVWSLLAPTEAHTAPPAPAAPSARLVVTAPRTVSVYPGGKNRLGVRAARDRFDGPVTTKFFAAPGLSAAEITVPAGGSSGETEVVAAPGTNPGPSTLTVSATATADGRSVSATALVEVTVLPLPPPPPRLAVGLSQKVQAYQRGKNAFAVRIARGAFDGAVEVTFDRLPDGVTVPAVVVPAGRNEAPAELTAEGSVKVGRHAFGATARGGPMTNAATATAETTVEVLGSPKLPVDVVFVLDCTRSMEKVLAGIDAAVPKFGAEMMKAQLDARFGLVGFQDTTLGQPIKTPLLNGDRMTADVDQLRAGIGRLKLGGGGGEGASSLDGLVTAADYPFRAAATRVVLLVTDDGPKRVDGLTKSAADAVKYLKEKKIDQLHIVALPEHRKPFEPLWEGAGGKFFDLKDANTSGAYDRLTTDLGRAVWESLPVRPENKPEPSGAAPVPTLPPAVQVKVPNPPPTAEPEEAKVEKPAAPPPEEPAAPEPPKGRRVSAAVAWAVTVAALVCVLLLVGQATVLPGGLPSGGVGAVGYGAGIVAGFGLGAAAYFAFEAFAGPFAGRLVAGSGFGLCLGVLVPVVRGAFRREPPAPAAPVVPSVYDPPLPLPPPTAPAPSPVAPVAVPAVKPNITAPKPADGCPTCGRTIPGAVGTRYCMLCDDTF